VRLVAGGQPFNVVQSDQDLLKATVYTNPATYRQADLPHNTLTTVWTPATGKRINLVSFVASAQSSGYIEVYEDTALIVRLEFGERKAVPLGPAAAIQLASDTPIKALWVDATGTTTAYLTLFGFEE